MAPLCCAQALEPRILLDGAGMVTMADQADNQGSQDNNTIYTDQSDQYTDNTAENNTEGLYSFLEESSPQAVSADQGSDSQVQHEIAFIDTNIRDYQTLIDGIRSGVEVFLINGNEDGFSQIVDILTKRSKIDGIHIFSHGAEGQLHLGTSVLKTNNMDNYSDALQTIKNSISEDGDILLYGCDVATGDTGSVFLNNLAAITGSDIAASSDSTGSSDAGGDWDLEIATGTIDTESAVTQTLMAEYDELFIAVPTDIAFSNYDIVAGNDLVNGLGGGGFDTQVLATDLTPQSLDDGYMQLDISSVFGSGLNFGGTTYNAATDFYIGTNGYVTFGHYNTSFSAVGISGYTQGPMIAGQYDDIDLSDAPAQSPGGNSTGTHSLYYDIDTTNNVVTITFDDVGPYNGTAGNGDPNTGNAFQIRLHQIDGSDFAIELRYENISWLNGNSGLPTAGWTAGDQENYGEVTGSGTTDFLNLETASNIGQNGVFVWEVRNGSVFSGQNVITEDAAAGTFVSALEITDADVGETHTCTLLDDDGGRFELYQDGGVWKVRVAAGATFDYETATTRTITVQATGDTDGLSFQKDLTINIADVNEAPTAGNKTVTTNEDTNYTFAASDFNFSDQDSGDTLNTVKITSLESSGSLQYNSGTWQDVTLNQEISKADIDAGKLRFVPAANVNGNGYDSFGFQVSDGDLYSSSNYTMTVDVTPVQDAPTAGNKTVTTNEDTNYTFAASDFNFSDADSADTLNTIQITSLESAGTLQYNNSGTWQDVILNQEIVRADIDAGKLRFAPAANVNGNGYDSFGFKVSDGTEYSASAYSMTVDVTPVNDVPTAANNTVTINEDTNYTFTASDFNFSDADSADTLNTIQITSLESAGTLQYNNSGTWQDVILNQEISKADIDAGKLRFVPASNANGNGYDSFGFKVSDGTEYSASAYSMTVGVTPVQDAPTGGDKTVTTNEDTNYIFAASDFNFSDADSADTLNTIQITSLESAGTLQYNNSGTWQDVTLNQEITKADIDAGNLRFAPVENVNGNGYDSFGFKVSDGTEYSASAYTMTVDVTSVNDAPSDIILSNNTVVESAPGETVGTISSNDPDTGDIINFSIINDESGLFEISGTTLKLKNEVEADFETAASHSVTIRATDSSGAQYDKVFVIVVSDQNEFVNQDRETDTTQASTEYDLSLEPIRDGNQVVEGVVITADESSTNDSNVGGNSVSGGTVSGRAVGNTIFTPSRSGNLRLETTDVFADGYKNDNSGLSDIADNFPSYGDNGQGDTGNLIVNMGISDLVITPGESITFEIPTDAFSVQNDLLSISYEATLSDGSSLPEWLLFSPETRSFTGTPPLDSDQTHIEINVIIRDSSGNEAVTTFDIDLQSNEKDTHQDRQSKAEGPPHPGDADTTLAGSDKDNFHQNLSSDSSEEISNAGIDVQLTNHREPTPDGKPSFSSQINVAGNKPIHKLHDMLSSIF
ncbi:MAG: DUF4347 domain-containing protein [Desulfobacteraceae bacterium]